MKVNMSVNMAVAWIISSVLFFQVAYGLQQCSKENPLEICGLDINEIHVPVNMSDMLDMCRKLKSYYTCYEEHHEEFPPLHLCGYPLILKKAEPSLRNLCRQGSLLHEGFVRNMACFNNLVDQWDTFYANELAYGEKLANLYQKVTDKRHPQRVRDCVKEYQVYFSTKHWISNNCGSEGMIVYQELYLESEYYHMYCTPSEFKRIRHVVTAVVDALLDKRIEYEQIVNN